MKKLFLFIALFLATCTFEAPNAGAQPCQWNYSLIPSDPAGIATATYCGNVIVAGTISGASLNTYPSMAAMSSLTAAQMAVVQTMFLRGFNTGNPAGGGVFVWITASQAATLGLVADGGVFIAPSDHPGTCASGCATRQVLNNVSTDMYGIIGDSSGVLGNGTNWGTRLSAMVTTACNFGYNISIAQTNGLFIRTTSALNVTGCPGIAIAGVDQTKSKILYDNTITGAIYWQNPNGIPVVEGPKISNLYIRSNAMCVQGNSIGGGFTDDGASQQSISGVEIDKLYCDAYNYHTAGQVGIQLSKAGQVGGTLTNNTVVGYCTPLDLEGYDSVLSTLNFYGYSCAQGILAISHGTFGNNFSSSNDHIVSIGYGGTTADAPIVSNYRSLNIVAPYIEQYDASPSAALLDYTGTGGAQTLTITGGGPIIIAPVGTPCFVKITDGGAPPIAYNINNAPAIIFGTAAGPGSCFNGANPGASVDTYWASNYPRIIKHGGNGNGDIGIPFNTVSSTENVNLPYGIEQRYTPNLDGLQQSEQGATVLVNYKNAFVTDIGTTTTNRLFFSNPNVGNITGTFDIKIRAYKTTGAASKMACAVADAGTPVAWPALQAISAQPAWYTFATAAPVATSAGIVCYADTGPIGLFEAQLADH